MDRALVVAAAVVVVVVVLDLDLQKVKKKQAREAIHGACLRRLVIDRVLRHLRLLLLLLLLPLPLPLVLAARLVFDLETIKARSDQPT